MNFKDFTPSEFRLLSKASAMAAIAKDEASKAAAINLISAIMEGHKNV